MITARALKRRVIKSQILTIVPFKCIFCDDECIMYFKPNYLEKHTVPICFDVACSCIREDHKKQVMEYLDWNSGASRMRQLGLLPRSKMKAVQLDGTEWEIYADSMMELVET